MEDRRDRERHDDSMIDDWRTAEAAWGRSEPQPELWAAGDWSLERRGDELADIRFDGTLILRMVRFVARDRDWNTVPVVVDAVRTHDAELALDLRLVGFGANLAATVRVTGGASLRFEVEGVAHGAFERNRLGFVVLHPPSVSGEVLSVFGEHPVETRFPIEISPHQPAMDITALEWTCEGVASRLDFEGDVFEMEDQRNWTDASFKTYSTPLSRPFPVTVADGERFEQALELTSTRISTASSTRPGRIALIEAGSVPELVLGASTAPGVRPEITIAAAAILVELDASALNWPAALRRATDAGLPLDVRIIARDAAELPPVLQALADLDIIRVGVFSATSHVTEPELWQALDLPGIPTVAGARSHFTELNRTRTRLPADADSVTISITPQMHATERSQLIESIAMQAIVTRDALAIAGARPVHVGPITLRPRFNAVATTPPPPEGTDLSAGYGPAHLPDATDARQESKALAAWTVASFAAVAGAGASSVAYFEEWGPRGLFASDGTAYPVLEAIIALHDLRGGTLLASASAQSGIHLVGAAREATVTVIGANLTPRPQVAEFDTPAGPGRLDLEPFGTATWTTARTVA